MHIIHLSTFIAKAGQKKHWELFSRNGNTQGIGMSIIYCFQNH